MLFVTLYQEMYILLALYPNAFSNNKIIHLSHVRQAKYTYIQYAKRV